MIYMHILYEKNNWKEHFPSSLLKHTYIFPAVNIVSYLEKYDLTLTMMAPIPQ